MANQYLGSVSGNIKVVNTGSIPKPSTFDEECNFKYLDFSQCEWYEKSTNPEQDDKHIKKLLKAMKGKQSMLWVMPIGKLGGYKGKSGTDPIRIMTDEEASERYSKQPCCMKTSYGSLIPQILMPTDTKIYHNELKYELAQKEDYTYPSGDRIDGYRWRIKNNIDKNYSDINTVGSEGYKKCNRYGVTNISLECVDNMATCEPSLNAKQGGAFLKRAYRCNTTESKTGKGCFALCYNIANFNPKDAGNTDEQKKINANMSIKLSGMFGENINTDKHEVKAIIPAQGTVIGSVDESDAQGTLSYADYDVFPENCDKDENGGQMRLKYIIFYPLFHGFVMTSSVLGSLEQKSGFLIKYEDENCSAESKCEINNSPTSSKQLQDGDKDDMLMRWFPALFQQASDSSKKQLQVHVKAVEKIRFNDFVDVDWTKCKGKFAYYPIYFTRKIKFTLYFKGEYLGEENRGEDNISNKKGKYRFYPIVCTNLGKETGNEWSTSDSSNSDGKGYMNKKGVMPITHYRHVIDDPKNNEAIYAVDFEYSADALQRYPIEFLGVVITLQRKQVKFRINNGNGSFQFNNSAYNHFTGIVSEQSSVNNKYLGILANLSVSSTLEGISGNMVFDGYALSQGIGPKVQSQSIGEINLGISQDGKTYGLFSGYAMELSTNDSEGSCNIGVNLYGVNRKAEDMQLICAPMWDGDRLEMVCNYFQKYLNLQIKMIDYTVKKYANAKKVSTSSYYSTNGTWRCDTQYVLGGKKHDSVTFRLPRSIDWRSPAVVFNNGTTCLEALIELGKMTGCVLVPQLDGTLVYYELNNYGIPFYVNNQTDVVVFNNSDIVSFSIQPHLENKFNSIATFGLLKRKNAEGKWVASENVDFASFYTRTNDVTNKHKINPLFSEPGLDYGTQIPWSKHRVYVEQGFLTKDELKNVHDNSVKFSTFEQCIGNLTVRGNTLVNHIFQKIQVGGVKYFVISIEHNVDAGTKQWTTSYQIQSCG